MCALQHWGYSLEFASASHSQHETTVPLSIFQRTNRRCLPAFEMEWDKSLSLAFAHFTEPELHCSSSIDILIENLLLILFQIVELN
jgi:hypothetical protein